MPVSTRIVGDFFKSALVALFDMATKLSGTTCLNVTHHLNLLIGKAIVLSVLLTIKIENISYLVAMCTYRDRKNLFHLSPSFSGTNLSRGLSSLANLSGMIWRYIVVVFIDLCPRRRLIV
jgi:hypothetical protein